MFQLLVNFHVRTTRWLTNVSIGVRLLSLMGLAVSVSLVLAAAGIGGLAASKESLRSVYEDRMLPVQQLAEISQLMLTNRLLLQTALSKVQPDPATGRRAAWVMDREFSSMAAHAIEKNIETINTLWRNYDSSSLPPAERALADRFAERRSAYIKEALLPAVLSLQSNQYASTQVLAAKAATLFEKAGPDLQALNRLQFDIARQAYDKGVRRYENTRLMALGTLGVAVLFMSWLGWMLSGSIVNPLKQVIVIFQRISNGKYDSTILVDGHDEISEVMLALGDMQTKLGLDEEAIHQLAFYDPLTKLPNRRLLRDRLQRALSLSSRSRLYGAVLMVDLDNFKSINDTRGHEVGDRLLVEIAQRIQLCVRQADTVARLGGDEFIVMLVDLSMDEAQAALQAERIGEKILAAISQPCMLSNKLHHPAGSMGLCLFVGQSASMEDLLKRADISMYQAKNSGRNALQFFDPQIQASLEARMALESELHEALPKHQFKLYYQMQQDHRHGVLGAELLLRWEHPKYGMVMPDQFIPIAEESGLIVPIGEWVLRSACEQLTVWAHKPVVGEFLLAVNVSPRQFREPDFVDMVDQVLMQTGANPARLKLELTESLVLHNVTDTIVKMKALNQLGVHFSMDDFGTGYSSLSHLTHLPIHQLKIDRSFVHNIASNRNDAIIVQTIIGMANNLGVAVIAEGVETPEQRACLERFGCFAYQGYLFGRPMPLPEFERLALEASTV